MEETFGGCRSATTNGAHYTNAPPTSQENLHYEIKNHNAESPTHTGPHGFPLSNQLHSRKRRANRPAPPRVKPLKPAGKYQPNGRRDAAEAGSPFRVVQCISRPLRSGLQCRIESESGNAGAQAWNAK
ncbi:hypothetical protein EHZ18_27755 [Burkholderia vietnamiensis]|nr:hypothetical protein EHZ18_27755 [Burkholderia vietnamiensis]